MTKREFIQQYIVDVKIRIENREQCYEFQKIAFEMGVRVHSMMDVEKQIPILYNISDEYPEHKHMYFAKDMDNLVIYDNGTKIQQSGFYWLEKKKEINYDEFIEAYKSINYGS